MSITTFVELRASISQFEASMAAARAEMAKTHQAGESSFGNLSAAAKVGLGAVAGAVIGVGVKSLEMASQFQASMERLSTQAGVPQAQIEGLSKSVLSLAGQVGFSPNNLAEALFHVESSFASTGISGKQAMDILKTAAEGAQIGGANLVDVTNALDAAIASGIPGVQSMSQAMGALNAIVGAGDMTMQNLAEALGSGVLAVVKNYGLSLTDVGAALATFGDNNIRGAQAATYLRMAVQSIAVPAKAGAAALVEVGMTTDQMAKDMQRGGLITALQDLKQHFEAAGITGNRVGQELTTIFGKRAGSGIAVLYDQLDRLRSKYGEIEKGASQFDEDWKKTQATFAQQWKDAVAGVDAFLIALGSRLLPVASQVLGWFKDTAGWIGKHRDLLADVAKVITSALVPALLIWGAHQAAVISEQVISSIGMMIVQVGNLAREMTAMGLASDIATGPLGMIAAAIGALVTGFGDMNRVSKDAQSWIDQFSAALPNTTDKVAGLQKEFDTLSRAMHDYAGTNIKVVIDGQAMSYDQLQQKFEAAGHALDKAQAAQKANTQATADATKVQDQLNLTVAHAPIDLKGLTQAEFDAAEAAKADKNQVDDLKHSLDALIGVHLNAEKAVIAYNQSIDALTKGIVKGKDAVKDDTVTGQANITMVIDAIDKATLFADAQKKEGVSTGEANKTLHDHIQQILGVATQSGLTSGQVDWLRTRFDLQSTAIGITDEATKRLIQQYGKVPTRIATDFVATLNLDPSQAEAAVATLAAKVASFQNRLAAVAAGKIPVGMGVAAAGGITQGPAVLVGEGSPTYPEWIIPSDPTHRANALALYASLGQKLAGFAAGGVLGDMAGAAGGGVGTEMAIRRALINQSMNASTQLAKQLATMPQWNTVAAMLAPTGIGGVGPAPGNVSGVAALMQQMAAARGWIGPQWDALYYVEMREAGFNMYARNPSSGAYGLAQGITGPSWYYGYGGDPNTAYGQITAMLAYIAQRYGSPAGAAAHEAAFNWYDVPPGMSGILPPGLTMALNTTGANEYVYRPGPAAGAGVSTVNVNIYGPVYGSNIQQLAQQLVGPVRAAMLQRGRQTVDLRLG